MTLVFILSGALLFLLGWWCGVQSERDRVWHTPDLVRRYRQVFKVKASCTADQERG